ncbi:MAG: carboxypeptidase-like regulatory domain-containing protein [Arenimonas sp.]|uniref:carboxypeptidase-like regulatory domain-containing protein n=1 Tax=Arenimonas sp. TaxID=1872635 RepID=UPI0025C5600C|nr:carboxypeptidase-like regulatory domain-containing protein [Arenimonas sp.]MBW8368592.1 carboxypeptidase-like regulatory domain-containing protein [Arenimonas sp.]
MTATLARHPLAWAIGLCAVLVGQASAQADAPATVDGEPAPYQDRVIDAGSLQELPPDEDAAVDTSGLPRSIDVQLLLSRTDRGGESFNEQGLALGGFWETTDLGAFSLDATLLHSDRQRTGDQAWGGNATLWQRGLYLDGGWRGDNGLGVQNTALPSLLRDQYRFILPSVPFAGASTDWRREGSGLQLMGGYGRGGVFDGARVVGFDLADGNVGTAGMQWQWAPQWTGALAAMSTDGRLIPAGDGGVLLDDRQTSALLAATGWRNARNAATLTLQSSTGDLGDATGGWLDATADRGRFSHRYGLFRLDPGLAWGALPIANDAQGAYYRIGYSYARWTWNVGLDSIDSVSGNSFEGSYANVFARYQASTRTGLGGGLYVRESAASTAYSTQLFVERGHRWGQTRLQLDQVDNGGASNNSWEAKIDHALPMRQGTRLSFSLGYGSLSYDGEPATDTTSVAAIGGFNLGDRVSLDGSARYSDASGPDAFRGTDLNLNLSWQLSRDWSVVGSLYENRGTRRSPFILDPLAPDDFIEIPRDRSLFVSLRYQRRAGTVGAVLGGAPGGAVGTVAGHLFLDENADGQRAASEQPAANVTVLLDGRYSVRTDSDGYYEFTRVSVGKHVVTVIPDNLPLPWFIDEVTDRRTVDVAVRETQRVDFGARRQR